MNNLRESSASPSSTPAPLPTLRALLWQAIDAGKASRRGLAMAMEISEDGVARMLADQLPKLQPFRDLLASRLIDLELRERCLEWLLRPSPFRGVYVGRTPERELDANKDGRIDGRDAVAFEGQALSAGSAALEGLCTALRDGRLSAEEREKVRVDLRALKAAVRRVEECLEHEQGGGMRIMGVGHG